MGLTIGLTISIRILNYSNKNKTKKKLIFIYLRTPQWDSPLRMLLDTLLLTELRSNQKQLK